MFGKRAKQSGGGNNGGSDDRPPEEMIEESLQRAIAEQKMQDPLVGVKVGSRELTNYLLDALKDEQGVHIESILSLLGSLAGFACQICARNELDQAASEVPDNEFVAVETKDGQTFFFGDAINRPLAENEYSVWSLAAGAAQHLGCEELPDIDDIFRHVAASVGSAEFGIPRIPDGHNPMDLPLNFVKFVWPRVFPLVEKFCESPAEWPILFGLSIQEIIVMGKEAIDPQMAVLIVMESAIPMSKIDPGEI